MTKLSNSIAKAFELSLKWKHVAAAILTSAILLYGLNGLPSRLDFAINIDSYSKVAELLRSPKYKDVKIVSDGYVGYGQGKSCYARDNTCPDETAELLHAISKVNVNFVERIHGKSLFDRDAIRIYPNGFIAQAMGLSYLSIPEISDEAPFRYYDLNCKPLKSEWSICVDY